MKPQLQNCLDQVINVGVPGLSASISTSSGQVWSSAAGLSSLPSQTQSTNPNGTPLKQTHLLPIGSITKPFISVIIYQLIESSHLSLTSTISDILSPSIYTGIQYAETATISMLLSHTSGIESWEDDPIWIRTARGQDIDINKIWNKTETLEYIRHARTPGEGPHPGKFSYSNTNFTFLGLIIEKLTGNTVVHEIQTRIFGPCAMNHTFLEGFEERGEREVSARYHWATDIFLRDAGLSPAFVEIEGSGGLIDVSSTNLSTEWAAGGMLSTPSDLCLFATALRDGKLISKGSLEKMMEWREADEDDENEMVGGGLFRWRRGGGGEGGWWVGHFGGVLGGGGLLLWKDGGGEGGGDDCVVSVLCNVGSMHSGSVPGSSGKVITVTDFLRLAMEITGTVGAN